MLVASDGTLTACDGIAQGSALRSTLCYRESQNLPCPPAALLRSNSVTSPCSCFYTPPRGGRRKPANYLYVQPVAIEFVRPQERCVTTFTHA